jgi:ribose transport system permease protein
VSLALPISGVRARRLLAANRGAIAVLVLLALLMAVGSVLSERFRTPGNILNVYEQSTGLALVSLGQTLAVLTGGIDLSVGSTISLISLLFSGLVDGSSTKAPGLVLALVLLSGAIGVVNGLLVVGLRVHPLIVTLGTGAVLQGCALLYSLVPIGSVPPEFESLAYGRLAGIPIGATLAVLLFAAVALALRFTVAGRLVYMVGDAPDAATLIGLPKNRVLVLVYGVCGAFAGLTGLYLAARFGTGHPYSGADYTLASITPVVVGGTLLSGGRGGVFGTLLGVFLISMLNNVLNFLDVSTQTQLVVQGLVVILAVSVYVERRRKAA